MRTKLFGCLGGLAIVIVAWLAVLPVELSSQQSVTVQIDTDDIGGVVTSAKGPEAGVWVIAETTELPTRFASMVVTDDRRALCLPDLPKANYSIWVRGYGLVDSPKVKSAPGKILNLKAVVAPNEAAAAQILSGDPLVFDDEDSGEERVRRQGDSSAKDDPRRLFESDEEQRLRQLPCDRPALDAHVSEKCAVPIGKFANAEEAWFRRIQSGQCGVQMFARMTKELGGAPVQIFCRLDRPRRQGRVAAYETRAAARRRAQYRRHDLGLVDDKKYLHDLIASDRRYPTVNAYGPLYGSTEYSIDMIPILDPKTHTVKHFPAPVRDADTPEALGPGQRRVTAHAPRRTGATRRCGIRKANNHNAMFDRKGRVWFAARLRAAEQSGLLQEGLRTTRRPRSFRWSGPTAS